MTTTVDLAALAASGQTKVTLLGGTITSIGSTGTDFSGFDDAASVYVEVKVQLRDNSRGAAQLTLLLQGSDDGNSWSTLETFAFGNDGTQTATVDTPNAHLRVSWTVARNTEWFIDHVTVAPASLNAPGGGGGGSQPIVSALPGIDNGINLHDTGEHPLLWDVLYENASFDGPILAIPAGLGLDFDFDGSSATITATEDGVWAFTLGLGAPADATASGRLRLMQGVADAKLVSAVNGGELTVTLVVPLASGVSIAPTFNTQTAATAGTWVAFPYLQILRLG